MDIYDIRFSISSDFIETFNIGGFHHSINKNYRSDTCIYAEKFGSLILSKL